MEAMLDVLQEFGDRGIYLGRVACSYSFIELHVAESLLFRMHIFQLAVFNLCPHSTWYLLSTIFFSPPSARTSSLTRLIRKISSLGIFLYEISLFSPGALSLPLTAAPSRWEQLLYPPWDAPSLLPHLLPARTVFANTLHKEATSIKINRVEIWETETTPTSHFIIGNGNLLDFHLQAVACIRSSPCSPYPCPVFCTISGSLCMLLGLLCGLLALSHRHPVLKGALPASQLKYGKKPVKSLS